MKSFYVVNNESRQKYFGNAPIFCVDSPMIHQLSAIHKEPVAQILCHFHRATPDELQAYQALDSFLQLWEVLCLWQIAKSSRNRDEYVRIASRLTMWKDLPGDMIPVERLAFLGDVWDSAHKGLAHLVSRIGMSVHDLCEEINVSPDELTRWYDAPNLIPETTICLMLKLLYSA